MKRDIKDLFDTVLPEIERVLNKEKNRIKKDWKDMTWEEMVEGLVAEFSEFSRALPLTRDELEEVIDFVIYGLFLIYYYKRKEVKNGNS